MVTGPSPDEPVRRCGPPVVPRRMSAPTDPGLHRVVPTHALAASRSWIVARWSSTNSDTMPPGACRFAALWEMTTPRQRVIFCQQCDGVTPATDRVCVGCGTELFDPFANPSHAEA
jgi:hypothetical protein